MKIFSANKQKGVSLIITFFIMVIILFVILSISVILYTEAKIIRNIGNSVGAFYAADSGIEKVLYYDMNVIPTNPSKTATIGLCTMLDSSAQMPTGWTNSTYCSSDLYPSAHNEKGIFCKPTGGGQNGLPPGISLLDQHYPNGCDPDKCDNCEVDFSTNIIGNNINISSDENYTVKAKVSPSSDRTTTALNIYSTGFYKGTQRAVNAQIFTPAGTQAINILNPTIISNCTDEQKLLHGCSNNSVPLAGGVNITISAEVKTTNSHNIKEVKFIINPIYIDPYAQFKGERDPKHITTLTLSGSDITCTPKDILHPDPTDEICTATIPNGTTINSLNDLTDTSTDSSLSGTFCINTSCAYSTKPYCNGVQYYDYTQSGPNGDNDPNCTSTPVKGEKGFSNSYYVDISAWDDAGSTPGGTDNTTTIYSIDSNSPGPSFDAYNEAGFPWFYYQTRVYSTGIFNSVVFAVGNLSSEGGIPDQSGVRALHVNINGIQSAYTLTYNPSASENYIYSYYIPGLSPGIYTGQFYATNNLSVTTPDMQWPTGFVVMSATITGTAQVGQTLTAHALPKDAVDNNEVSYQWQISNTLTGTYTNIAGATSKTYTPVAGGYVRVEVTGTGEYGDCIHNECACKNDVCDPSNPNFCEKYICHNSSLFTNTGGWDAGHAYSDTVHVQ